MAKMPWWWTAADQAELDVLLWVLVTDVFEHRGKCRICLDPARVLPCPRIGTAIGEVVEWYRLRVLLSKAEGLRRRLELAS